MNATHVPCPLRLVSNNRATIPGGTRQDPLRRRSTPSSDSSNGAAVATLDCSGARRRRVRMQAFCTAKLDLPGEVGFEKMIGDSGEPMRFESPSVATIVRDPLYASGPGPDHLCSPGDHPHNQPRTGGDPDGPAILRRFLDVDRPDVMFTYGGDPVTQGMIAVAKRRGIPVVFAIHNFGYTDLGPFATSISASSPSEFARRHYRDSSALTARRCPTRSTGSGFGSKIPSRGS